MTSTLHPGPSSCGNCYRAAYLHTPMHNQLCAWKETHYCTKGLIQPIPRTGTLQTQLYHNNPGELASIDVPQQEKTQLLKPPALTEVATTF